VQRRTLLKLGLGGGVLLALGGVGLYLRETVRRQPASKLEVLDEREFSVLWAVAERMCPGGEGFPRASEVHVAEKVDAFLANSHPGVQADVKKVLGLLESALAGSLLDGRTRPFTQLDPTEQDATLDGWRRSRIAVRRTAFQALHGLCMGSYYASPETYAAVGYPGPPDYGQARTP
jgi:hypothetical protein